MSISNFSTGPRSVKGKAVSRLNALKTGIYAKAEVVTPSEDNQALGQLTADYYDRFHPTTPEQRFLVDALVSDDWLLRRLRRSEAGLLTEACKRVCGDYFTLGEVYQMKSTVLERLQRRVNATRKSYLTTLDALNKLPTQPEENQALAPVIGFVPSPAPDPAPTQELFPAPAVQPPISGLWKRGAGVDACSVGSRAGIANQFFARSKESNAGNRAPHQAL